LHFFRTDSNRLDTVPSAILDVDKMNLSITIAFTGLDIEAADLDNDGDDELILRTVGVTRDTTKSFYPEVWIYRGGSEF
jgi:hypothetical protein